MTYLKMKTDLRCHKVYPEMTVLSKQPTSNAECKICQGPSSDQKRVCRRIGMPLQHLRNGLTESDTWMQVLVSRLQWPPLLGA